MKNWILEALEEAKKAEALGEVPIGAVIVCEGKIIAQAYNLKEGPQNPLGHAELLAISQAAQALKSWRLIDCELYVTLEPCPMCLAACGQARIRKVFYGAQDQKSGALSLGYRLNEDIKLNHRFEAEFLKDELSGQILSSFFQRKRLENRS